METLKALFKQPYWIIALILGAALVALPYLSFDKEHLTTRTPIGYLPAIVGIILLFFSFGTFGYTLWEKRGNNNEQSGGLDLSRVKEADGALWTYVSGCEIRVVNGRIEDCSQTAGAAVVLPCNEYFDDRCVADVRSSLGAYANRVFEGQAEALVSLIRSECQRKLGKGVEQQKTEEERAESFGAGKCILLRKPLGSMVPVALVSTTTQRAREGLASRISYLFDGIAELFTQLADARINEVAMPILGSGHGQIDTPLAFVGLLLAIAEAARYGQGGQRPKRVTIVVFKKNTDCPAQVDGIVVRRALALIGSHN